MQKAVFLPIRAHDVPTVVGKNGGGGAVATVLDLAARTRKEVTPVRRVGGQREESDTAMAGSERSGATA
jgi:hypothetical protein